MELVLQAATPLAVEDVVLTADGCCAALGRILAADVTNKVKVAHDWLQPRVVGWCGRTLWLTARRWEPIVDGLVEGHGCSLSVGLCPRDAVFSIGVWWYSGRGVGGGKKTASIAQRSRRHTYKMRRTS